MNTNNESKKEVFFFNTINITEWMKCKIEEIITDQGYTIVFLNNNSEIVKRMNKQSIYSNVNLEFKDQLNKTYYLTGYSSASKSNEYSDEVQWLVDKIKLAEEQAIEKFVNSDKDSMKNNENNIVIKPTDLSKAVLKKTEDVKMQLWTNLKPEILIDFLTKQEYMSVWMCGNGVFEGNDGEFTKVGFEHGEFYNFKKIKSGLKFEYKSKDFAEKKLVTLKYVEQENSTRFQLILTDVPLEYVNGIKRYWYEKIFMPITFAFPCLIKLEN